jgi:hypothetical protein
VAITFGGLVVQIPDELLARIIAALITMESGNVDHGVHGVPGDGGKAVGPLQIHRGVVDDVNRIYKCAVSHGECDNLAISKIICGMYLQHYVGDWMGELKAVTHAPSKKAVVEMCARVWHEGPTAARRNWGQGDGDKEYIARVLALVEDSK